MHRKTLLSLSVLVLFALLCANFKAAFAQSATSGAIGGTIFDQNGAALSGATITATNTGTGADRTVTSSSSGDYRITALEPGGYTVVVTMKSFETYRQVEVVVTVGSLIEISPKLVLGNVTETVEVTGDNGLMHTESPEISTTIDQNAIDNLPINGRRWSSFALLTPGVVSDVNGFGLLSFRGISTLLNNSTVDGADNNQAFFSEERGRTRASYSISQSAVQEFQVNTSNYSAEYGRAAGGVINTVTKSGANQLHGELFFYDRDNAWGATNPYTLQTTQIPNSNAFQTYVYKPKDWRKQFGFGVGGRLIRDKLFWFYSYDREIRNFPGTARASDPADTFAPADPVLPAGTTCASANLSVGNQNACSEASALSTGGTTFSYQQGAAYYQQGLGIISSFLGPVPRSSDQALNFPKLDWQINDRNHLALQYNRYRRSAPAGYETQASNFDGRASFGDDFVKEDFGIARLTTVFSPSLVNQLLFQYGRDFEYSHSQTPLPNELPLSNNQFNRPPETQIGYEFDTKGFYVGKPVFFDINALPEERRMQGMDSLSWSHGTHVSKAGIEINRVFDYINNLYAGNGSYSYDYNWDFIADYLHTTVGLGGPNYKPQYYSFTQSFGNPKAEVATTDYAGFVTDDWRVNPRLTLTLGVRYEYEYIPVNPFINTNGNPATALIAGCSSNCGIPQTANKPDDRNNIGPRVGFALDIFGTGKTILRGGYGMYYGRIINSNIIQTYLNSGGLNSQLQFSSTGVCQIPAAGGKPSQYIPYPTVYTSATDYANYCSGANSVAAYLDKHMQNPQVHEFDLAIEQNLGWNTVLSVTYMGSLGRELPISLDQNLIPAQQTRTFVVANNPTAPTPGYITYPHGGKKPPLADGSSHTYKFYGPESMGSFPSPYYQVLEFKSAANSNYNALAVQVNHHISSGFSLLSNYTWAHAMDYNPYLSTVYGSPSGVLDPLNMKSEYGNSSLNIQQRFVLAVTYRPTLRFEGWKKQVLNGWQISPIVQAQTGLPYSAGLTNAGIVAGAYSGILGAGGANRVPDLQRNSFNMPNTATVNMRVGKNFFLDHGDQHYRLEVFAEAFNLLNHQNITSVNTIAYYNCRTASGTGCTTTSPVPSGPMYLVANPLFGTNLNSNSNTIYSQRQIQISGRLHF